MKRRPRSDEDIIEHYRYLNLVNQTRNYNLPYLINRDRIERATINLIKKREQEAVDECKEVAWWACTEAGGTENRRKFDEWWDKNKPKI